MSRDSEVAIAWFGKLPTRGDFVRAPDHAQLTQMIDHWLTQGLAQLSTDPRWKQIYDLAQPSSFAFLGVRSHVGLAGHLVPSSDASGRRFPFVATGSFDVDQPLDFLPCAPLAMAGLWRTLDDLVRRVCAAPDPAPLLAEASHWQLNVELGSPAHVKSVANFAQTQTLASLQALLAMDHPATDLRRLLLALGLLLQPVPASGVSRLDMGLRLPLPGDRLYQSLVAAWWLHLVAPFLTRGDFELLLFLPSAAGAPASLSIGFAGGAANTLLAMLDPDKADQALVTLDAPEWVEQHCHTDSAMRKLSSYLQQPQLSLAQAGATFQECFLGL